MTLGVTQAVPKSALVIMIDSTLIVVFKELSLTTVGQIYLRKRLILLLPAIRKVAHLLPRILNVI